MKVGFCHIQDGGQPIHFAASGGKEKIIDVLIDEYHVDPLEKVHVCTLLELHNRTLCKPTAE